MARYGDDDPPPDSPRAAEIAADAADPRNRHRVEIWVAIALALAVGAVLRNDDLRHLAANTLHTLKAMMGFS